MSKHDDVQRLDAIDREITKLNQQLVERNSPAARLLIEGLRFDLDDVRKRYASLDLSKQEDLFACVRLQGKDQYIQRQIDLFERPENEKNRLDGERKILIDKIQNPKEEKLTR